QLSRPDMCLPIGYALAHPDRLETPFGRLDWSRATSLDFEPPDLDAFPCLGLAYDAGRQGGMAPAWLNAANEVAVAAFLGGRIGWRGIAGAVHRALDECPGVRADTVEAVIEVDRQARRTAELIIERMAA